LVRAGEAVASWIYRHSDSGLYVAERGGGAWRDGRRLTCPAERSRPETLRGAVLQRFLTEAERTRIVPRLDRFERVTAGYTCSGFEYPAIVEGRQEFALFQRLLPWDHAPGVLLLTEAGGVARRPDGTPFTLDHTSRGLLLASSPVVWETVRDALFGA
ncbi:MAG TPA: inositol monophosphatase family protein, partial [Thermomicrobiales bacterium]|nr:inositol monophosphatase family protein [Thermomicrobiales bacterium]